MSEEIYCVIPARGGSKGIPGKNLYPIYGRELIWWSIKAALGSKYLKTKNIVVNSDNDIILNFSNNYCKTFDRDKEFAQDNSSIEDVFVEFVSRMDLKEDDIVIHLQPTSPVRISKDIDRALEIFWENKCDCLFSGYKTSDICLWEENPVLKPLTYNLMNRGNRQDRKTFYEENGSIYIFKAKNIILNKNRFGTGENIGFYAMPKWKSFEIDELEDIEIVEHYLSKLVGD